VQFSSLRHWSRQACRDVALKFWLPWRWFAQKWPVVSLQAVSFHGVDVDVVAGWVVGIRDASTSTTMATRKAVPSSGVDVVKLKVVDAVVVELRVVEELVVEVSVVEVSVVEAVDVFVTVAEVVVVFVTVAEVVIV